MSPKRSPEVDAYLAAVEPKEARASLKKLRTIIRDEAPEAEECISYGMPGYKLNGYLVGFAVFKNHCSLFPGTTVKEFQSKLKAYKTSKGTIQFPHGELLPEPLIRQIVRARVRTNMEKASLRKRR